MPLQEARKYPISRLLQIADAARWFIFAVLGSVTFAVYLFQTPALTDALASAIQRTDLSATIPVVSVVIGAVITYLLAGRRERKKDLRDRLLVAAVAAIQEAHALRHAVITYGFHAPRGGGRIRPAGQPDAEWTIIPEDEARAHDAAAAAAIDAMMERHAALQQRTLDLTLIAPQPMIEGFVALTNRTYAYLQGQATKSDPIHRGADHATLVDDIDASIRDLTARVRRDIRGDRR